MAGFMVPTLPLFLKFVNQFSIMKYTSVVQALNEFRGIMIVCPDDTIASNSCPWRTGEAIIEELHFEHEDLRSNVLMIVLLMVLYRLLAWVALVMRARRCLR